MKRVYADRHDHIGLVAVEAYKADVGVGQAETVCTRWNAFITVT